MGDPAVSQLQVIDGDGEFRSREVEVFMSQPRLANGRQDYQVVAIMGPQSSGKSTLLNYVVSWRAQVTYYECVFMCSACKLSETLPYRRSSGPSLL
eukprot:350048-Chlamydomonas_euryale.AAC.10